MVFNQLLVEIARKRKRKLTEMKFTHSLFFGLLLIVTSCNEVSERTNSDPVLTKVLEEMKEYGGFEEVEYEFPSEKSKKISNQKIIKVTYTNSKMIDLDEDDFGKKSAEKIYNLNSATRNFEIILITLRYKSGETTENINIDSDSGFSIKMNVSKRERNFIFNTSELD